MNDFQVNAREALAEFAQGIQLSPYHLDSGNGTEYKNYLNDTVFTVYHDRLDNKNHDRIEVALGAENIATELSCSPDDVEAWLARFQQQFHAAQTKSPIGWPRVALWSLADVHLFRQGYESLLKSQPTAHRDQASSVSATDLFPVDERVMREIMSRRGQDAFRVALLHAYGGSCAISDCTDTEVLEAAHITAHSETPDYRPNNGLLLRADLHTLFDLRLLSIDPRSATVVVSRRLSAAYLCFSGRAARLPMEAPLLPDPEALMRHFRSWQANEKRVGYL